MIENQSSMDIYGIYGAGGCGRSLMPIARSQYAREGLIYDSTRLFFIDDSAGSTGKTVINGHRLLSSQEFSVIPARNRYVNIAIADGRIRERLVSKCAAMGFLPWSIHANNVILMDDVQIAEGASLSPFVVITSNIRIGRHFHANLSAYVEHDCIIGDFVTFAPGVMCNGNVIVEDYAYLGAGCIIRQGTTSNPMIIGAGATVGMGAVVTRSVAPATTVVGNPARIINK